MINKKYLEELQLKIKDTKKEAEELINKKDIEGAKGKVEEVKNLQSEFDLAFSLYDEEVSEMKNKILSGEENAGTVINSNKVSFGDFVKNLVKGIVNVETVNGARVKQAEDGGYLVPQDIRTKIIKLRRDNYALENYVNVEKVYTLMGSRVVEVNENHSAFDLIEEQAQFPEFSTPKFEQIKYETKKYGGYCTITYELLRNTSENFTNYLVEWITKKSKMTRNLLILNKLKEATNGNTVTVTGLDSFKEIFNKNFPTALKAGSIILTNQSGLQWLDTLKYEDGRYCLQPDINNKSRLLLFGLYEVVVVDDEILKNEDNKIPFYCGNLKSAITLFDRERLSIEMEQNAGANWLKDLKAIKVREFLDIQQIDKKAVVKGLLEAPTLFSARTSTKNSKSKEII